MTESFTFDDDGSIPNSRLPLLLHRGALPPDAAKIEQAFAANGWPPAWRNGVYPFHHFHSTAHEALGIARGQVSVLFGGPGGKVLTVRAGDVVVIPAGVGHCNKEQSNDLLVVGAYPANGAAPDLLRGDPSEHGRAAQNIQAVPLPETDPVNGSPPRLWLDAEPGDLAPVNCAGR